MPIPQIIEAIVNNFGLTIADLKSRKRDRVTALARQVAMYLIRQETDCTLAETGKVLGNRTPSTVTYAYQKIAIGIFKNPMFKGRVLEIQGAYNGQAAPDEVEVS